ncbi:MAG: NUDIX domain-containing protein, partial [Anaerolineales bacterium]|nr:NUDIX domain-containing protein [Anaerolineales bacterium]
MEGDQRAEQQYPEPTVGALIFNQDNQLLIVKTHKWHGNYTIPGGHVEMGERLE